MTKKKRKKLTREEKRLAARFIGEEIKTKEYPRKQAIAIGISRARSAAKKARRKSAIESIMARYT
jgi:hypothetical protein